MTTVQLPSNPVPDREKAIIQAVVHDGLGKVDWGVIESTHGGHVAQIQVFADALKLDLEYEGKTYPGVRINVAADTQQQIADSMGCLLMTAKVADLRHIQAHVLLEPRPRSITATTKAMIEHSQDIDIQLEGLGDDLGIVDTVGKHWLIDALLAQKQHRAMNYGWHFRGTTYQGIKGEVNASLQKDPKSGQYLRLIQGRGTRHDRHHSDYSQVCVLMARMCVLDGEHVEVTEVLSNPDLAPLFSHSGAHNVYRQPGVPEVHVGATIFGDGESDSE